MIQSISHHDQMTTAYNLSISDIHTFYVGAGAVLVHNSCFLMNREILNGKAPDGVDRVDQAAGRFPGEQDHVHFTYQRATLNRDGTWGHGGPGTLTNPVADWLRSWGWNV